MDCAAQALMSKKGVLIQERSQVWCQGERTDSDEGGLVVVGTNALVVMALYVIGIERGQMMGMILVLTVATASMVIDVVTVAMTPIQATHMDWPSVHC